jgi:[ribosomal protein S5]-alanine N-acetyltransferase
MDYFLTSKRLGFRRWTADDEPLAVGLWCDPQVTELIGGPWTAEEARVRLAEEIDRMKQFGIQYWPVFLRSEGQHAGCAGLRPYNPEQRIYELGIHLLPAFWGQGFGAEAARAVIDYAFGTLHVAALCAGHHPSNTASRQLLKKLGFVYLRDQLYKPTGLMHPAYLLARAEGMDAKSLGAGSIGSTQIEGPWQHQQEKLEP